MRYHLIFLIIALTSCQQDKWFMWETAGKEKTIEVVKNNVHLFENIFLWDIASKDYMIDGFILLDVDKDGDWDLYYNGYAGMNTKRIFFS